MRMAAGVDFGESLDADVGVNLGGRELLVAEHLMLAAARTLRAVATLQSISLRSVPGYTGCPRRLPAYQWRRNDGTCGMIRAPGCLPFS